MSRIFISYSSRDEALARKIHASMSSAGLNPFLAGISIEPGSHWTDVIFEELEEAEWVFFLASEDSFSGSSAGVRCIANSEKDDIAGHEGETPDTDKGCSIGLPRQLSTLPGQPGRFERDWT